MADDPTPPDSHALAPADAVRLLLSTAPPGEAQALAHALVEERLAACVNLVPGVRSIYRWKDAVADDPETLMVIKAPAARVADLARRLGELHPYEVPELLVFRPRDGLGPYLEWAAAAGV